MACGHVRDTMRITDHAVLRLISQYVPPKCLAVLSCTCRDARLAIAECRRDISFGRERLPIVCDSDPCRLPFPFVYTPVCVTRRGAPVHRHFRGVVDERSCSCQACLPNDTGPSCLCLAGQPGSLFTGPGRMDVHACAQRGGVLWQCSEACSCGDECWARLTRRGLCVPVVLRHGPAGWACYAASPVRRGTFLAEYAGVVLTSAEADAALRAYDAEGTGHALLVVREAMLDGIVARTNVDATRQGNVARFFNHRCGAPGTEHGPNTALLTVRTRGLPLPSVGLFAARDIEEGEELCISYGEPPDLGSVTVGEDGVPRGPGGVRMERCLCRSPACGGWLPCR